MDVGGACGRHGYSPALRVGTLLTMASCMDSPGAAERDGHEPICPRMGVITLIDATSGKEKRCKGITIAVDTVGGTQGGYLSMNGQDFAEHFGVEGKGTSYGQLIARGKALAIFKDGEGEGAEFWELREEDYIIVHKP